MKGFLKEGDRFRLKLRWPKVLRAEFIHDGPNRPPRIDPHKLTVSTYGGETSCHWTEIRKAEDGGEPWERRRVTVINPTVDGLENVVWRVHHTFMGGGGTGHGPHDVFPDGHHVVAESESYSKTRLVLTQSGCFTSNVDDSEIEVLP